LLGLVLALFRDGLRGQNLFLENGLEGGDGNLHILLTRWRRGRWAFCR
jgi:hypothetical protein